MWFGICLGLFLWICGEKTMTHTQLQNFFKTRPAISKSMVAEESGVSIRQLEYVLAGERTLTERVSNKLLPVLKKYGWK